MFDHVKRSAGEFVEYLRTSPLGQQFLEERRREVRERRRALIAADRAVQDAERDQSKRLAPSLRKAEDEYAAALDRFTVAGRAVLALRAQAREIAQHAWHERALLGRQLEAIADERIGDAVGRLDKRFERSRLTRFQAGIAGTARGDSGEVLMDGLKAAYARLNELKFQDVDDLDAAIATIESSVRWPDSDVAPAA